MTIQTHECPVERCRCKIPRRLAMCKPHWKALDPAERSEISRSLKANGPGTADHIDTLNRVAVALSARLEITEERQQ